MVVVNNGISLVGGPEVSLQVTSVVPTSVGRIVFASVGRPLTPGRARDASERSCTVVRTGFWRGLTPQYSVL